jgi:lysyl-tRNA synthetase class 1
MAELMEGDTEHRSGVYSCTDRDVHEHSSTGSTPQKTDCGESREKSIEPDEERQLDNPVFHIHDGNPPRCEGCLKFSMLLNLVQACSTSDEAVLMQFVKKYVGDVPNESMELMAKMVSYAVAYYNEFVAHTRVPQNPDSMQSQALNALKEELLAKDEDAPAEELQNAVFNVGKNFFGDDVKHWFETIYGVLFGTKSGPKIGSFISLYGINNTAKLIAKRISDDQR